MRISTFATVLAFATGLSVSATAVNRSPPWPSSRKTLARRRPRRERKIRGKDQRTQGLHEQRPRGFVCAGRRSRSRHGSESGRGRCCARLGQGGGHAGQERSRQAGGERRSLVAQTSTDAPPRSRSRPDAGGSSAEPRQRAQHGFHGARRSGAAAARLAIERQKALAELDRMKKAAAADAKAIADLEEEARRAGVPPGWLR